MTSNSSANNAQCCPVFDPNLWRDRTHYWKNKLFLQDHVWEIMHIPLNMSPVVKRMMDKIESANALPHPEDFLMLCHDPSPWKSEIYMTVTKNIPGEKMTKLSGTFFSKVFDGPYSDVPQWIKQMDSYLASHHSKAKKYYFHYAYCPKCSERYGHNYCIGFAQLE